MINYKIHELIPNVFALEIPDGYNRGMLFLRSQEFYESPFDEFRGKHFDVFHYMDHYRKWKGVDYFSYPDDWAGYNIPGEIIENAIKPILDANNGIFPTPYDFIMLNIIKSIRSKIKEDSKWYLIGVGSLNGRTVKHEIAHALFYISKEYKEKMCELVLSLPRGIFEKMEENLKYLGYTDAVIVDEIQAYMSTGLTYDMEKIRGIKKLAKAFDKEYKKFSQIVSI